MSLIYLPGEAANLVLGATLSSTSAATNFPITNLNNSFQWKYFQYASAASGVTLTADLGTAKNVTFCSIHYHNLDSGVTSVVLTSDTVSNFASPTSRATMTVASPSFYSTFVVGTAERYWRITFNGTNGSAIKIGKWVLGAYSTLTQAQLSDWGVTDIREQAEPLQGIRVNKAQTTRRMLALNFRNTTTSAKEELRTMMENCEWGEEPLVVVPDSTEAPVFYTRPKNSLQIQRGVGPTYQSALELEEDRFPVEVT